MAGVRGRARLGETKRRERIEGQDCLACSQSPHDETVVARCAQYETVLPLALESRQAQGWKDEESEDERARQMERFSL